MLYVANDELSIVLHPYPACDTFISGFNIAAYFTRALLLLWIHPCKLEDCDIPLAAERASTVFYMAKFAWLFIVLTTSNVRIYLACFHSTQVWISLTVLPKALQIMSWIKRM